MPPAESKVMTYLPWIVGAAALFFVVPQWFGVRGKAVNFLFGKGA